MDALDIQPLINEPAIFIKDKRILVIADLHIGIESELIEQGLNARSQTNKMINHIEKLCKKHNPEIIILLGDIKHNIPTSTIWERKDVKKFLKTIEEHGSVHIFPGNHDGNIHKLTNENMIIHPSDGDIIEGIGFIHGHRWPNEKIMKCETIITAHTHPTVMFTDRRGFKTFETCWVKTDFDKTRLKDKYPDSSNPRCLVMPAFNPLCGGIAVNQGGIIGPIGKILDIANSQIYLLDGSCLGKSKDLV